MPKSFDIPDFYRSEVIRTLKVLRREQDPRKNDLTPSVLDLGEVQFVIARHFGLCFGVENAIEIAYKAVEENPEKRIFLLSEMIHNPYVNADLEARGIRFLMSTDGTEQIPVDSLQPEDVVIVPAFGTTREMFQKLADLGVDAKLYNTTCPFVEKVWKRSQQLGAGGHTIIIHGKPRHEETRATFSHASENGPALIVRDITHAKLLGEFLSGNRALKDFCDHFPDVSDGFDPERDLKRVGVVNQTTMLAEETKEIAQLIRASLVERYGEEEIGEHFADTRDTLCYATTENQRATRAMLREPADFAIVVGGYNSSNTSHLVELCEERVPTYFIKDEGEILSRDQIRHLSLETKTVQESSSWLPEGNARIYITAGASCPDVLVDRVLMRITELYSEDMSLAAALKRLEREIASKCVPQPKTLAVISEGVET